MTGPGRAVRVCGVGHVALDMVFEVERIPQEPVKVAARALRRVVGGMTANACVAAARLGAGAQLVLRLGLPADHQGEDGDAEHALAAVH